MATDECADDIVLLNSQDIILSMLHRPVHDVLEHKSYVAGMTDTHKASKLFSFDLVTYSSSLVSQTGPRNFAILSS